MTYVYHTVMAFCITPLAYADQLQSGPLEGEGVAAGERDKPCS